MIGYIDTSVLMRTVFQEKDPLVGLSSLEYGVSSELLKVEALRTLDRYRLTNAQNEDDFLERLEVVYELLKSIELVRISPAILTRAGQPFPTVLGTLDAIHLSTLLLYSERPSSLRNETVLCSHDEGLKKAAKAMGVRVLGS